MKISNIIFFANGLTSWDIQIMSLWIIIIKPAYINEKNCVCPIKLKWTCWHEWQWLNHRHHDYFEKECSKCGHDWDRSLSRGTISKVIKR